MMNHPLEAAQHELTKLKKKHALQSSNSEVPEWIDSHCHLDFSVFDEDRACIIDELQRWGCQSVVVPGVYKDQWNNVEKLAQQHPEFVLPAYGLHPYFTAQHLDDDLMALEELLQKAIALHPRNVIALGEIGLDFYYPTSSQSYIDEARQRFLFKEQVSIAKKWNLPLILHARKSHDDICKMLKDHQFTAGGIVHAFTGSAQQAARYIDLGFVLGIGGAVTYDRAKKLRRVVQGLSSLDWVLETDSPDMLPAFESSSRNTPLNSLGVAMTLSTLLQTPLDVILNQTTENVRRVFNITVDHHDAIRRDSE